MNFDEEHDAPDTESLDEMGQTILRADEIRRDDKLYRLVVEHLKKKSKQIKSIAEMRDKMANEEMKESTTGEYERD